MEIQTPIELEAADGWTSTSMSQVAGMGEAEMRTSLDIPAAGDPPPVVEKPPVETPVADIADPVETPEPDASPVVATDATGDEPDDEPEPAVDKPKKRHWAQPRIDKLTREKTEQAARADAAEARARELEAKLAGQPKADPVVSDPAPVAATPATGGKPRPAYRGEGGFEEQGKSWEEFQIADGEWLMEEIERRAMAAADARIAAAEKKTTETQAAAERTAAQDLSRQRHETRIAAARTKYPDFDQQVATNLETESPFLRASIYYSERGGDLTYHLATHPDETAVLATLEPSRPIFDAVLASDRPDRLLSYFARHSDEFERIKTLQPGPALLALGRLEQRLDVAPSGVSTEAARQTTKAKPPLRTPSGSAPIASSPAAPDLESMEFGPELLDAVNKADLQRLGRRF